MKEKISVLISSYNQKHSIEKTLLEWNKQIYKDFAVYICDDGSDDGTADLIKNFKGNQYPLHWSTQERKGFRLASSLNKAMKQAKGEYMIACMGDSWPKPDYLQWFAKYANPNLVLCGVRENVTVDGDFINYDWRYKFCLYQLKNEFFPIKSQPWGRITGNGLFVPMWAMRKVGYWPENYNGAWGCDDNALAIRLYAIGLEFAELPKARLCHVEHTVRDESQVNIDKCDKELKETLERLSVELAPQNICLVFDDFSPVNNQLFFLRKLKGSYPNLKITVCLIPATIQTGKEENWLDHMDLVEELKQLDWFEYIPHGWFHPDIHQCNSRTETEFANMNYLDTHLYIKRIDTFFKKIGLPYQKIFKAPQYRISEAAKNCFRDEGWALAVEGDGTYFPTDIKWIDWNWNINQQFVLRKDVISYSHVQDNGNGFLECYENLLNMPSDANFMYLSEMLAKKYKK